MNETMFELDSTFQHNLQNFFHFLILHAPQIGLGIYNGLIKDGYFKLYGKSFKIFTKPNNDLVAATIDRFPDLFWVAVNPLIPESVEPFMHESSRLANLTDQDLIEIRTLVQLKSKNLQQNLFVR